MVKKKKTSSYKFVRQDGTLFSLPPLQISKEKVVFSISRDKKQVGGNTDTPTGIDKDMISTDLLLLLYPRIFYFR